MCEGLDGFEAQSACAQLCGEPADKAVNRAGKSRSSHTGTKLSESPAGAGENQLSNCLNRLRTSPSISASRWRKSSIRRTAWITVE